MTQPAGSGERRQPTDQIPASTAGTDGRDRDAAGRPRNARPRDGLGRPLDRSARGEPTTPDDLRLTPGGALALAQELLDAGRPFHAHEVLELAWKSAPADEQDLWQGLAQLAVGLTHARRGNSTGAVALLRRGAFALASRPGAGPHGLDVAGIHLAAIELADRIDRIGLAGLAPADLRLRLTTHPG